MKHKFYAEVLSRGWATSIGNISMSLIMHQRQDVCISIYTAHIFDVYEWSASNWNKLMFLSNVWAIDVDDLAIHCKIDFIFTISESQFTFQTICVHLADACYINLFISVVYCLLKIINQNSRSILVATLVLAGILLL